MERISQKMNASAFVLAKASQRGSRIEDALNDVEGITELYLLAGDHNYLAKLEAANNEDLGRIVRELRSLEDLEGIQTFVVFESIPTGRKAQTASSGVKAPYRRFLEQLLIRGKNRCNLHDHMRVYDRPYMGASSSVAGLKYFYYIARVWERAEIYIDRLDAKENKRIFDQLVNRKREIEETFGQNLNWERLDTKRACRISLTIPGGYSDDESTWEDLQETLLDAIIRLEIALEPHLKKLD